MSAATLAASDPRTPGAALAALAQGGVVVLPSANTYGLVACGTRIDAIEGIYALKERERRKPLGYLVSAGCASRVAAVDERAASAMELWPGPLSLILPKLADVPQAVTTLDSVLLVCPDGFCAALADRADFPIVCTSANLSGEPPIVDAQAAADVFGDRIALVIDGGRSEHGANGTILDLTTHPAAVLREGPYPFEKLKAMLPDLVTAEERLAR